MKTNKTFYILFLFAIVFLFALLFDNNRILQWLIVLLYFYELLYYLRNMTRNITIVLFLVAFFTFLLGRVIMPLFFDESYFVDIFYSYLSFTQETYRHIYISLFLTLFFIFIGYNYFQIKSFAPKPKFSTTSFENRVIRKCAKVGVLLTSPFSLLLILDKIKFVLNYGYSHVFIDYETSLPTIVIILTALFEYLVYLYLATLPSKKESKQIIFLYVIISLMNMIAGDRGEAMLAVFVIIFYYYLRNYLEPGGVEWIGKKGTKVLIAAVPFVISLLLIVSYMRDDNSSDEYNVNNISVLIGSFFYQQGASVNVIGCSYQDQHMLPSNKLYSLGAITDYFRNNYLSRLLFGIRPYPVGSVELATKGNSLDSAITYIEDQNFYFNGGGMGSSFIAEAWHDFGYLGVIVFALFYGFILARIPVGCAKNVWIGIISLMFFKYILYAPRARATTFLVSALSVAFWPLALVIYLYAKQRVKRLCQK